MGLWMYVKNHFQMHMKKRIKTAVTHLVMQVEELQDAPNSGLVGNVLFGVSDYATRALAVLHLGQWVQR